MKKVLVVGYGFIGYQISKILVNLNYDVTCTGLSKKTRHKKNRKIKYISQDLSKSIKKLPSESNFIIHLAGDPRTFLKKKDGLKQIKKNTLITKNLLKYSQKSNCTKFIFFSSSYVYSGSNSKVFHENLKIKPVDYLGKSKKISEMLIKKRSIKKNNIINFVILRVFSVYGKEMRSNQFLNIFKKSLSNTKVNKIDIYNPNLKKDLIHVNDLSNLVIKVMKKKTRKKILNIFNVATGISYSMSQIINILKKKLKSKHLINFINVDTKLNTKLGNIDQISDIKKVISYYKWKPQIKLNKGISTLLKKNV